MPNLSDVSKAKIPWQAVQAALPANHSDEAGAGTQAWLPALCRQRQEIA